MKLQLINLKYLITNPIVMYLNKTKFPNSELFYCCCFIWACFKHNDLLKESLDLVFCFTNPQHQCLETQNWAGGPLLSIS